MISTIITTTTVLTRPPLEQVEQLFAWLNMAFSGEGQYNDLMLGFTCIFADHPPGSPYPLLLADAMARLPGEEERVGEPTSLRQRERGSLGAMGAGQWTGQFRTRPHALLDVRGLSSVEEWEQSLPRGCRRTLAKALDQSFSVVGTPIRGGAPAPHSTLAHFRCVAEHEVRLASPSPKPNPLKRRTQQQLEPSLALALALALTLTLTLALALTLTVSEDPESAHLYVVPYAATNMEGLQQYYEHLRDYISAEQPYFRRHGGKDHVWLCSADHGGNVMQARAT